MTKLRIGIIGAGFMGRTNAETVARYPARAELIAAEGRTICLGAPGVAA